MKTKIKMVLKSKWIKSAMYALVGAFLGVFILLCIAVNAKNKTIKRLKANQMDQTELVLRANARADSLAKLECVTVNNTVVINQKGLVNVQQANQISKTVATYTREEVLHALDSLNKVNKR